MAVFRYYDMENKEELCELGKALSSPVRLEILQLLYDKKMIIGEIAKSLNIPVSSTAFHIKMLENAGLVSVEELQGTRGGMKLCSCKADHINIELVKKNTDVNEVFSMEMPVGAFSSCQVAPTCGLFSMDGMIGNKDTEYCFYYPERVNAGILWSSSGYVEYKFANGVPQNRKAKKISISAEVCSEAIGYREDWKSDITLWINGVSCGMWRSPGDFGKRRGRLNPDNWPNGMTQYGMRVVWEVRQDGAYVNGEKMSGTTIEQLHLSERAFIAVRIGNKPNARHVGGFNLFGRHFGDYEQDIILTVEY